MCEQLFGCYFSSNADRTANDYTIYLAMAQRGIVTMSIRYKNAEPKSLYEIDLDAEDLQTFGQMCLDLSKWMQPK